MSLSLSFPTRRESVLCAACLVVWLVVTVLFVGFRPEHIWLALLIFALFFLTGVTRRTVVALMPFIIFGISYDWMNIVPNYEVNPVDVEDLYNTEKAFFGILSAGEILTPNEFFAVHNWPLMDFFAGVFYLCWVPLPIIYGLWLYFNRRTDAYLHFACVFLLVNLMGFAIYYIHPAAPPWYVALHGFEAIPGTPGEVAGLAGFDHMTGLGIFNALYARNANVFAAMPSLHSAYTFVAFIYAVRSRSPLVWKIILGVVTLGIWFTAVYTSHHYILDVLAGIATALVGTMFFEWVLMRIKPWSDFMRRYAAYVTLPAKQRN